MSSIEIVVIIIVVIQLSSLETLYLFSKTTFIILILSHFFQPGYSQGLGSLQFASGSSPCVSCTNIYSGHSLPDCSAPPLPLSCYYAQMYLNYVDILRDNDRTKGLRLHMYTEGMYKNVRHYKVINNIMYNYNLF